MVLLGSAWTGFLSLFFFGPSKKKKNCGRKGSISIQWGYLKVEKLLFLILSFKRKTGIYMLYSSCDILKGGFFFFTRLLLIELINT